MTPKPTSAALVAAENFALGQKDKTLKRYARRYLRWKLGLEGAEYPEMLPLSKFPFEKVQKIRLTIDALLEPKKGTQ